ncbi:MAG TPA: threonine--tRNA ligase [Candidatus Megaira endosymbiont of Nemacystus decipiens]|nr:threonine--tRNA ligase [Candidatus Megaera endosymbiont of Nemacystus decipiens]
MINIIFPDNSVKSYTPGVTGLEIANSISKSLAKKAMVVSINGVLSDLSMPIYKDCSLRILTEQDEEVLEIIRHDAAHITAQAAKELFPDLQVTIGPAIKDGFYYDFAKETPFTTEDLVKIEARMHHIVKQNEPFIREEWDRDDAIKLFKEMNEHYKAEIIDSIPKGETITLYRQGSFVDLCRGPHCPSTGRIKHFKLMKVAGAYWRGDSKNEMLQRIYGTAWSSKEDLDQHLYQLEEAQKRDHRKLGKALNLFHLQEEAQGMVFWHERGWNIYQVIQKYLRSKLRSAKYIEVKTPMMVDRKLWEISGHWEKFRENMFTIEAEDKTYALKPMNCPCHVQIFSQGTKSYRDLPLRMAEFGSCHRNEPSGGLHGLLRVRNFVQDDAHIFCTEEQINSETVAFCQLLKEVYNDFGFKKVKVKFSDRPDLRAGSDSVWDKSEQALKDAVEEAGLEYEMNPGEGAFYGPKLEFVLTDAVGRDWQCGTLQVDFVLPERLGAEYISANGQKKMPVMLHRAIIGTFERFIGILIEEYAGKFPLWLAPVQVAIIGITNEQDDYIRALHDRFIKFGIRSELDISKEKVNYKIRNFSNQKVPIIAVAGPKEVQNNSLTLRYLGSEKQENVTIDELIEMIQIENKKYINN